MYVRILTRNPTGKLKYNLHGDFLRFKHKNEIIIIIVIIIDTSFKIQRSVVKRKSRKYNFFFSEKIM